MDLNTFSAICQERNKYLFPQCEEWKDADWLLALVGEGGEGIEALLYFLKYFQHLGLGANMLKKIKRGGINEAQAEEYREKVKIEFGDSLCYMDLLCQECGFTSQDAIIAAFNKVSERFNYSITIDENTGSINPSQLPDGMKHCTIIFKECEKGHGRLAAANWVDNGCPWCTIDELKNKLFIYSNGRI